MASAAVLTTLALVATAWALSPRLPGGDEPHYLIITQSLLEDGDLRIENNHQARDYASYFHGTLNPDFLHRGRNEVIYSIHAPGLPVLVAPLFATHAIPLEYLILGGWAVLGAFILHFRRHARALD